jgi:release factor glutamine methyltransferase
MLISEALLLANNTLKQQGINSHRVDALLLLCHCLSFSKEQVIFNPQLTINSQQEEQFFILIKRRSNKEPVSHLIGRREFYGIDFIVNNHVLDPRPDSETLIELVFENFINKNSHLKILELGVGSCCLLLTILQNFPNSSGIGVDISDQALEVAQKNVDILNLSKRAQLLKSNWFSNLDPKESFDLIVTNPPYIQTNDIQFLQEEVKTFEPKLALDGGKDGLDCYFLIAKEVMGFLKKDGILILEIGQNQEQDIIKIFTDVGLEFVQDKKDLSGIVRCLMFKKINENISRY